MEDKLVLCHIDSIRVSLTSDDRIVVLKQNDRDRYLPVWIGKAETAAITLALEHAALARPMTHDLMKSIIESLGAKIEQIAIMAIVDDVFTAQMILSKGEESLKLDCRPSDAIALAVRSNVPIYVLDSVLERAGVQPELETRHLDEEAAETRAEDEPNLSVFEDFLGKIQSDDAGETPSSN